MVLHILEPSHNVGSDDHVSGSANNVFLASIWPLGRRELHPARVVIFATEGLSAVSIGLEMGMAGRIGLVRAIGCVPARVAILIRRGCFLRGQAEALEDSFHERSNRRHAAHNDDDPRFCRRPYHE